MSARSATVTAFVEAPPGVVFPRLRAHDPTNFYPRSGILPAVIDVRDQTGAWDVAGQTRTLGLDDGGTVVETLDSVSPPLFTYDLTRFTGVFGVLVAGARSEWRVVAEGAGSSITWTYAFTARPARGLLVGAIVRFAWAPYMRKVLPKIAAWTAASD